ncbi:MAG: hypothetical protein R2834_15070 [Rhodothermales bacterium]
MAKQSKQKAAAEAVPDQQVLTERQALRLSELSGVPAQELVKTTFAEAHERVKWLIDPQLLFFRRICGRVVKNDPVTGVQYGVPNATVHVQDTDCSFFGFFPGGSPFYWLFPFNCRTEEIATVKTDACGNFCVFVPRWEIDWILRWRLKYVCYPDIRIPNLEDLVRELFPIPQPDPPPFRLDRPEVFERLKEVLGAGAAVRLEALRESPAFGASALEAQAVLEGPAFTTPVPPPLPVALTEREGREKAFASFASQHNVAARDLSPARYLGPFLKCKAVLVPEWQPIFDVPDITFRVTQDYDFDGVEEVIYNEGFFDVRWNAGPIPNVTLVASGSALASPICAGPVVPPCSVPTIVTAGLMPLEPGYHSAAGYALRPNRPRRLPPPDAAFGFADSPKLAVGEAPYAGTIQLHGCHRFAGAQFYRLVYAFEGGSEVPFTQFSWNAPRLGGGAPVPFVPDANGWYPIVPAADLVFPHWLLNWETWRLTHGHYAVKLQTGNAAKSVIGESAPVAFEVDNTNPIASFGTIAWREAGSVGWQNLPDSCPVLSRPAGQDIEIRVSYTASAPHFRNVQAGVSGCDGSPLARIGDMTIPSQRSRFERWHIAVSETGWSNVGTFLLPAGTQDGAYTVALDAYGRAFNPAGSDAGPGADWHYDPSWSRSHPRRTICVITA